MTQSDLIYKRNHSQVQSHRNTEQLSLLNFDSPPFSTTRSVFVNLLTQLFISRFIHLFIYSFIYSPPLSFPTIPSFSLLVFLTSPFKVHPSSFRFGGRQLLDLLCSFRTHATVPVFIHIGKLCCAI